MKALTWQGNEHDVRRWTDDILPLVQDPADPLLTP